MIPVAIVTGFLGSGKTTLIGRILRDPAFARTAVIVNEFGEIGLDHELIASSDETLLALTTGCLCCAVRTDLVATLLDLQLRREAGEIAYERVLIETSGLADPAPILHALMTDHDILRRVGEELEAHRRRVQTEKAQRRRLFLAYRHIDRQPFHGDPPFAPAKVGCGNVGQAAEIFTDRSAYGRDEKRVLHEVAPVYSSRSA